MDVIIVQSVTVHPQIGIVSAITIVDKQTGEILRRGGMARYNGSVKDLAFKSLQSAIDDSTERGESQDLETYEIYAVGTYCRLVDG